MTDTTVRPVDPRVVLAFVAGMLVVALLPLPYIYYTALRGAVLVTVFYTLVSLRPALPWSLVFVLIGLCFAFGRLDRSVWALVDIATALVFMTFRRRLGKQQIANGTTTGGGS